MYLNEKNKLNQISKMINIFSALIGSLLFLELVFVVALLKPFKEPYLIRDFWCNVLENFSNPSKIVAVIFFSLCINTFLEISWEKRYYGKLLEQVNDPDLVLEFYLSKISMCYTCFFMTLFLLLIIERIAQFLIRIARLLEFELMCRHAILTKEDGTQVSNTTVVLSLQDIANYFDQASRRKTLDIYAKRQNSWRTY